MIDLIDIHNQQTLTLAQVCSCLNPYFMVVFEKMTNWKIVGDTSMAMDFPMFMKCW